MTDREALNSPTDEEVAAWADGFIKQNAYNRAIAVQIATEAAKWVRGRRVQVGWYYEIPATGGSGLRKSMSNSDLAELRRVANVWHVYRVESGRESVGTNPLEAAPDDAEKGGAR